MGKRLNLKAFRASKDLSQSEMAEILGIQRTTYAAIEQGARQGSVTTWQTLQDAFEIPNEEMYSLMKCKED